jgi:uncharacterized protein YyaL (SSP411 family)
MRTIFAFTLISMLLMSCNEKNTVKKEDFKNTNDLINETSPYLLQHAHNPVNWKAWSTESLKTAKDENKLIIISIGYSACHWCHVMEEESFENDSIAKIMNDNFVNIKVDREERPDIDQIYMNAVQLMTGKGGWPLNCVALPDGKPIFGGTYFTKEKWRKALIALSNLYKNEPEKVVEYANKLVAGIQKSELLQLNSEKAEFKASDIVEAINIWKSSIDNQNGGLLGDTKFPMPRALHFLLRYSIQNKDEYIQKYLEKTLTIMSNGGLYDAIGGGFCRYATDLKWHIPHFEKMLYDNAQLVSLYSDAFLVTKKELYKTKVVETLSFVERELMGTQGEFYSSLDADSKNDNDKLGEGNFYTWQIEELKSLLKSDFTLFKAYYNINSYGLWENQKYVLIQTQSDEVFAKQNNLSALDLKIKIKNWKKTLLKAREKRKRPHLDNKTLTSWNALMTKGYINAYRVFKNQHYLDIALKNANFILSNQLQKDGSLHHSYKSGKSTINGFSEDYANVIDAYISLYEVTLDEKWLRTAKQLMDYTLTHFQNKNNNMFYFTSNATQNLIARKMEIKDDVMPGSNSILANSLFQLGHYFSNSTYSNTAKKMLNNVKKDSKKSTIAYYNWLELMLNYTGDYYEVAISGKDALTKVKELQNYYLPNILIAGSKTQSSIPLLEERYIPNKTYIYVCEEGACKMPETAVNVVVSKMKQ